MSTQRLQQKHLCSNPLERQLRFAMAGVWKKSSLMRALILFAIANGAVSIGLPCKTEGQTCSALVSFIPQVNTNVSAITSLFQLSSFRQLLATNAWNFSLGANTDVPTGTIVKVPITCACSNATGISQDGPQYKVQPGNTLSIIAGTIFGGLMTYPDIQQVNPKITDVNKILAGDTFRIPLPCSCSPSASSNEIHYSYVVQKGDSLKAIASQAGTTESTLMALNNITNSSLLQAEKILDVPLKACSSNFSTTATDRNLLVASGSYAFTASNCLQCSCGPSDLDLYCVKANLSASCSGMTCKNSNLMVGSMSTATTSAGCNVTKCSYNGYTNKTILTHLETSIQPQCPANHVLPTLTTPPSIVLTPAPGPGTESPAPAPGAEPPASPFSGPASPGSPPSGVSGPSKSLAADSLSSLPLATILVLGLLILSHFGEW